MRYSLDFVMSYASWLLLVTEASSDDGSNNSVRDCCAALPKIGLTEKSLGCPWDYWKLQLVIYTLACILVFTGSDSVSWEYPNRSQSIRSIQDPYRALSCSCLE